MPRLSKLWHVHPGAEISLLPGREYVDIPREEHGLARRALSPATDLGPAGTDMLHIDRAPLIGIASPSLVRDGVSAQDLPWFCHDGMAVKLDLMRSCGLDVESPRQARIGSPHLLLEAVRQGIGTTVFNEPTAR